MHLCFRQKKEKNSFILSDCGGQLNPGMKLYIGITSSLHTPTHIHPLLHPYTHTLTPTHTHTHTHTPKARPGFSCTYPLHPFLGFCHWSGETDAQISLIYCEDLFGLLFHFFILDFLSFEICSCCVWKFGSLEKKKYVPKAVVIFTAALTNNSENP